jgi:hypothetical protein
MEWRCTRCGSDHINHKPKSEMGTIPLTILIAGGLTVIAWKVIGALTNGGMLEGAILFFMLCIVTVPLVLVIAVVIASAITGEGKMHTATCHNCGNEWHEKGACPPKQTAPSSHPSR